MLLHCVYLQHHLLLLLFHFFFLLLFLFCFFYSAAAAAQITKNSGFGWNCEIQNNKIYSLASSVDDILQHQPFPAHGCVS